MTSGYFCRSAAHFENGRHGLARRRDGSGPCVLMDMGVQVPPRPRYAGESPSLEAPITGATGPGPRAAQHRPSPVASRGWRDVVVYGFGVLLGGRFRRVGRRCGGRSRAVAYGAAPQRADRAQGAERRGAGVPGLSRLGALDGGRELWRPAGRARRRPGNLQCSDRVATPPVRSTSPRRCAPLTNGPSIPAASRSLGALEAAGGLRNGTPLRQRWSRVHHHPQQDADSQGRRSWPDKPLAHSNEPSDGPGRYCPAMACSTRKHDALVGAACGFRQRAVRSAVQAKDRIAC
jgi:hypothetical protein